ncbi:MAG: hypothetical protein JO093_07605 [Acidobacteria bacterium]|nr:hypothetical protein [Acidobacteriota bacterium]MBV9185470.1 hypothetical protein [Acidobacteriota bacterium]
MIEPQLVRDFMAGFYGYGHVGANYWFIGLEEGAIADLAEFEFVCTHHPEGARSNAHWDEIGRFIREQR